MPYHMASENPMNLRGRDLLAMFSISFLKILEVNKYKKTFSKLHGDGGNGGKTVMTAEEVKKFNACLPPSQGAK